MEESPFGDQALSQTASFAVFHDNGSNSLQIRHAVKGVRRNSFSFSLM